MNFTNKGRGGRLMPPDSFGQRELIVAVGVVFVIALLMVGAVLSYRAFTATQQSQHWVAHTYQVIKKLDDILLDLVNAETARRGFAVVRSEALLEPYSNAVVRLKQDLPELKQLTADNPRQQENFTQLEALARRRLDLLQQGIQTTRSARPNVVMEQEFTVRGSEVMKQIRNLIAAMEKEEQRLFVQRDQDAKEKARRTGLTILLSTFTLLIVLLVLGGAIVREASRAAPTVNLREDVSRKPWLGYAIAVMGTAVAAGVRWGLGILVGEQLPPYITFYPIVMFSALLGGTGAGLLATILSALAAMVFFDSPDTPHLVRIAGTILFCGINTAASVICGTLRDARGRIVAEAERLAEAEKTVRESEQRLRGIFDNAGVGIVEVDTNDRWVAANDRLCQILDYRREDLLGKTVHELTAPEDHELSDRLNRQLHDGHRERIDYEKRYLRRDGSRVWVHVTISPVVDAQGRWTRSIGTIEDISARKEYEQRLVDLQNSLKQANLGLEKTVTERTAALHETIGQLETFSYSIVHDLRAPLRSMNSFAHILDEEYGARLDPQARDYLQRICTSAERMDALIRDVLDYSRVSRDQLPLAPVDLWRLTEDVIHQYPDIAAHKERIHIEHNCQPVVLRANVAALTQVIANLITNALKFVPAGRAPEVRLRCEHRGDNERLSVVDNGIGVPAEYRDKIFGIFQRLHGSEYPGTGIGLAIVKKAIERMDGTFGFESEPGKGSVFWVEVPRA